jgi:hypothetical protein
MTILLLVLLVWVGMWWHYFYTNSYEIILKNYLRNHNQIYRPDLFAKQLFTFQTYQQALSWLLIGFNIIYLLKTFLWYSQKKVLNQIESLSAYFDSIQKSIKNIYMLHTKSQKKMLLVLISCVLIHQIYIYITIFIAMDESFSWLYFASQGVEVTMTHYPVPNNHVFYNLCSGFWNLLISDDILAMRMTSILSFWILCVVSYLYLYRKTNFLTAYMSIMIMGLGFSQSVFSVQARGYMLCTFFIVIALFCLFEYLEKRQLPYIYIFTISCILGFYTIPVFLFAMVAFYGYLLWQFLRKKHRDVFQTFFIVGLLVASCVYLLYLPVLVYSGKNALIGNENVSPTSYDTYYFFTYILPIAIRESIIYVFSIPKYMAFTGSLLTTIISFYLLKRRKEIEFASFYENFWTFILVSLLTAGIIIYMMQAFPFYRVWTYYAVFLAFILGIIMNQWMKTFVNIRLSLFLTLMFFFSFAQFHQEIEDFYDPKAYTHHKRLEKEIIKNIEERYTFYTSEEAFYVRFWLKYYNVEYLLKQNPCSAAVIIKDVAEPAPACHQDFTDFWFLRFYENH